MNYVNGNTFRFVFAIQVLPSDIREYFSSFLVTVYLYSHFVIEKSIFYHCDFCVRNKVISILNKNILYCSLIKLYISLVFFPNIILFYHINHFYSCWSFYRKYFFFTFLKFTFFTKAIKSYSNVTGSFTFPWYIVDLSPYPLNYFLFSVI